MNRTALGFFGILLVLVPATLIYISILNKSTGISFVAGMLDFNRSASAFLKTVRTRNGKYPYASSDSHSGTFQKVFLSTTTYIPTYTLAGSENWNRTKSLISPVNTPQSNKPVAREDWTKGLDVPFVYESFYQTINKYVNTEKKFPWHLVDNRTLFHNINIVQYVEKYAVRGDPFHPLPDYRNPCWIQSRSPKANYNNREIPPNETSLACLPYFYLAGFPKSGTTDLFKKLTKRNSMIATTKKEMPYWTKRRGVDAEPSTIWRKGGPSLKYIAPLTLRAVQPNAKFVVILRNPTDRAVSHYKHFISKSPQRMFQYMNNAIPNAKKCIKKNGVRECAYTMTGKRKFGGDSIAASLYYPHLKDWFDIYPRNQIYLIQSEEYYQMPINILNEVYSFLGIGPIPASKNDIFSNRIFNTRPWPESVLLNEAVYINKTKQLLDDFFSPINKKLAEFLKDDRFAWN